MKRSKFLVLIIFITFVLLPVFSEDVSAVYSTSGTLTSTNLLSGKSVASIDKFWYNASALGSGLKVQFSNDGGSTWCNALKNCVAGSNWTNLTDTGGKEISLSTLGWTTANFVYKMEFTSSGADTPILEAVRVDYSEPAPAYEPEKTMCDDSSGSGGGVVSADGSITPTDPYVASARGWSIPDYGSVNFPTYSELEGMYEVGHTVVSLDAVVDNAVNEWDCGVSDCEINFPTDPCGLAKTAVIFVNGNLNINTNFGGAVSGDPLTYKSSCNSSLAFIVSGNITIASGVNNIYGIFYAAGGNIITTALATPPDAKLYVFGSLLADGFALGRNLGTDNANYPAEQVIFMPQYFLTLKDLLGRSPISWREK